MSDTVEERRARNMDMFKTDLNIVMDDIRGMLAHYQIQDWEAYVVLRKPDSRESYVLTYEAAAGDSFARQIKDLHLKGVKEQSS